MKHMKNLNTVLIAALTVFALSAAPVMAAKKGGVALEQTTLVGSNTNVAIGKGAEAKTRIGSIGAGTQINGTLKQTTLVGSNTNVAIGKGAKATTRIGDIRNVKVSGDVVQTTLVGSNTNVAIGKGATAITEIGVIGE